MGLPATITSPTSTSKTRDFNRDRNTNFDDFTILTRTTTAHPATFSKGDADYSGTVDFNDFTIVTQNYNTSLPQLQTPGTPVVTVATTNSTQFA